MSEASQELRSRRVPAATVHPVIHEGLNMTAICSWDWSLKLAPTYMRAYFSFHSSAWMDQASSISNTWSIPWMQEKNRSGKTSKSKTLYFYYKASISAVTEIQIRRNPQSIFLQRVHTSVWGVTKPITVGQGVLCSKYTLVYYCFYTVFIDQHCSLCWSLALVLRNTSEPKLRAVWPQGAIRTKISTMTHFQLGANASEVTLLNC